MGLEEIRFYEHNGEHDVAVIQLVEKIYARGERSVVWVAPEQEARLSFRLWTYKSLAFLPHGTKSDGVFPEKNPIWITPALENPNGASYLAVTKGAGGTEGAHRAEGLDKLALFQRVFVFHKLGEKCDENSTWALLNHGREKGIGLTFWAQTAEGWKQRQHLSGAEDGSHS